MDKNRFRYILTFVFILALQVAGAQIFNFDLWKLRKKWGWFQFERANTARFAFYMGRTQKRTILYMNLARQDGKKFSDLVINPYVEAHPEHSDFKLKLFNKGTHMLRPSFRLWLGALPHAIISGVIGSEGHQGFPVRMKLTMNLNAAGENCSYGYFKGIDVTLQLLNSPGHRKNILNDEFALAAVSKFPHIKYGWNSVTTFSGPKFSDLVFRNLNNIKHFRANIGYSTDFKNSILDASLGMRFVRNISGARIHVGSEFIFKPDCTIIAPKIHFSTEFTFFAFGANLLTLPSHGRTALIARPEVSAFFPFTYTKNVRYFLDLSNSHSAITISYGYNINLDKRMLIPYVGHQLSFTYSQNFLFMDKENETKRKRKKQKK